MEVRREHIPYFIHSTVVASRVFVRRRFSNISSSSSSSNNKSNNTQPQINLLTNHLAHGKLRNRLFSFARKPGSYIFWFVTAVD
jgi:hypothetical protein